MKTLLLLPKLEESWESVKLVCKKTHELAQKQYGEELDILHVERDQIFKKSKSFLTYKKIICLDHSVETIQSLKFIKGMLKEDLSLEFYALGMASSFYWPLKKWGLSELLTHSDKIIVSSSRDLILTKYSLPQTPCELRPFRFHEINSPLKETEDLGNQKENSNNKLFYIGRLSFLKNIHGLISFFKSYREQYPTASLEIIGGWDQFDLPFFQMELDRKRNSSIYEDYIYQLIKDFDLKDSIQFHGQKTQEEVSKWLKANSGIFVSLSLQNDENYGLAADQSLAYGHKAILSNWGGHAELKKLFPNQVKLLKTYVTNNGPGILPSTYQKNLEDETREEDQQKLGKTIRDIIQRREEFNQLKKGDVLFHGNTDPYYHFLCLIYSGNKEVEQREDGLLLFGCEDILKN